jgi:hypothetical protein
MRFSLTSTIQKSTPPHPAIATHLGKRGMVNMNRLLFSDFQSPKTTYVLIAISSLSARFLPDFPLSHLSYFPVFLMKLFMSKF